MTVAEAERCQHLIVERAGGCAAVRSALGTSSVSSTGRAATASDASAASIAQPSSRNIDAARRSPGEVGDREPVLAGLCLEAPRCPESLPAASEGTRGAHGPLGHHPSRSGVSRRSGALPNRSRLHKNSASCTKSLADHETLGG